MTAWFPQPGPGPGRDMDEIVISRPLTIDEAVTRLRVGRRAVMLPLLGYPLGGAVILVILVVGLVTHWSLGWMLGAGLGFTALLGVALGLGLALGNDVLRRQARYELGASGVLTVTWSSSGGQVSAENFQRSFRYEEIHWMREVAGYLVLKFAMQWHPSPYVMALPPDFVPPQVRQQLAAAGVRSK